MTDRSKKIWKIVGISAGVLLIIGTGAFLYYKSTKHSEEEEENPYVPSQPIVSTTPKTTSGNNYTTTEVEKMQSWLLSTGYINFNSVIISAINNTGGVDGKMGSGFYTALAEAKKEGYIESLEQLYRLAN